MLNFCFEINEFKKGRQLLKKARTIIEEVKKCNESGAKILEDQLE
jgi:hypothetical protein